MGRREKNYDTKLTEDQRTMVENNLGLVYKVARKYNSYLLEEADIVQFGVLGLIHAVLNYSEDKGKFSSYAGLCIDGKIKSAFRDFTGKIGSAKDRATGKSVIPMVFSDIQLDRDINLNEDGADNFFNTQSQFVSCDNIEEEVVESEIFNLFEGRERVVAEMLSNGYTHKLIAEEIGVSAPMVSVIKLAIKKKLERLGYGDEYSRYSKAF